MKRGIVNSIRITISTLSLEGSAIVVLGGLAAFRPVPLIGEWVLCLLLLRGGKSSVRDGSEMCVCYIKCVGGLYSGGGESSSSSSLLDEQEVDECDKQDEGGERIEHESRGKVQALSFCQQLIQLWLRSQLKQQTLAK